MVFYNVERPSFLAEHVTPAKEVGSGDFVDVVELASVSKEVAEQVPTGFVLKQYRLGKYTTGLWLELFRGDDEINVYTLDVPDGLGRLEKNGKKKLPAEALAATMQSMLRKRHKENGEKWYQKKQQENPEEYAQREDCERRMTNPSDAVKLMEAWSLPGIAKRLRERHESLKKFFAAHGLPHLIVPTNFVVGRGNGPYEGESEYIYEVQPRVHPIAIPQEIMRNAVTVYAGGHGRFMTFYELPEKELEYLLEETSKKFAGFLKQNLTSDHLHRIQRELALLYPIAETLPREIGRVPPDIFNVKNLVIIKEGLRIIDTNQSVPFLEDDALQRIVAIEKENRSDDQYAILEQHVRYKRSVAFLKQVSEQLNEK